MAAPQWVTMLMAVALVAGCASEPALRIGSEQGLAEARQLLVERAKAGPVPLEIRGDPGMPATAVGEIAARGIPGTAVTFAAFGSRTEQRLLLAFDPMPSEPALACGDPVPTAEPIVGNPRRLLAVFCDGSRTVADVRATSAGPALTDTQRLIWRTTSRLFPDNWEDTYGFDWFNRIGMSLGGSTGF